MPLPLLALGAALAGQLALGQAAMLAGGVLLAAGGLLMASAALSTPVQSGPMSGPEDRDVAGLEVEIPPERGAGPGLLGGWWGLASLLLVTLMAAAFRVPRLGELPPGLAAAEAQVGLDAVAILHGQVTGSPWDGWPLFHLLTVGAIATLGQTVLAVRLPAVIAGICFAPALFLLGRQLGGNRLGTIAGLLGAVLFWHADFSRGAWGYAGWGLTCETLSLALLLHAARYQQSTVAGIAGILLGLALQASWAALIIVVGGLGLAARMDGKGVCVLGGRVPIPSRAILAPFLVYGAIAAGPVIVGLSAPDRRPEPLAAETGEVASSTSLPDRAARLLLMFNVSGDPSALHNLNGEAQLDTVTAVLLVLGVGLAAARWRSASGGVMLAWLMAALGFAAFTGHGRPPDSLAAIHTIPPTLLLAGSGLIAVSGLHRLDTGRGPSWRLDLILAVLGIIVAVNAHTLYVRRPSDSATWAAYASAEVMAAQQINRLVATHAIYLADVWLDHPTIQYLARDLQGARRLDAATTLPFEEDQTFAYFAPGRQEVVAEDLERLYEDGEIDRFRSPLNENVVVLRTFRAPAKVVSATRGVTVRTMSNDRDRTARFTLPTFTFNWPLSDEVPREAALDAFAVLAVDTPGPYRFRLDGPSDAVLEVNGAQVSGVGNEVSVLLPGGTQRLRVHARVAGRAKLQLLWAPPGVRELSQIPADRLSREQRAASGLLALYRSGSDPAAEPTLARVERYVQREGSPAPVSRPYVLDLVGTLDAPRAGTYRFRLTGSGAASMWIDDQALVTGDEPGTSDASIVLSEGDHRLRVRLVDEAAPTHLNLAWSPPGEEFGAIPTSRFNPPDGPLETVATSIADESTGLRAFGMPRVRWLASVDGEPRSVAVSEDGAVFVTNTTAREAQQVVDGGRALVPVNGSGASLPADLEIGPDGALWVLDALDAQLRRIDRTSGSVSLVGGRELGLYRPRGFAFAPDGSIVIADTGGSRLVRIRQDGTLLEQIGPAVGGSQRLRQPTDVAVGPGGELFVVNGEDGGVLRLSADGTFLTRWTVLPADTERGAHIAVAPDGAIWVSEPDGRRLSRFTRQGAPAGVVDQTREGRLLRSPTGIAVGPDGTLYVADGSLRAVVAIDLGR